MKGFIRVASLFGIPLAIVIWYDLMTNSQAYQGIYSFKASLPLIVGIHIITALLCLHTPLHLWRRFDALNLRKFCLTVALATFWVAVRLSLEGEADHAVLLKSALVFFLPLITYFILSKLLFSLSRSEFDDVEGAAPNPTQPNNGNA